MCIDFQIEEEKLSKVKEIIEKGAALMEEKDCETDKAAKKELTALQKELRDITGNKKIKLNSFMAYWSYTDLETVAKMALMPEPIKMGLTDEQITEIVLKIINCKYDEATTDYFLKVLKLETGLVNISDYIFWPDEIGLDLGASEEEIVKKILLDKRNFVPIQLPTGN